ncbi:hypothetical protein BDR06DRAFT_881265, partial [Suillus hirtellus]
AKCLQINYTTHDIHCDQDTLKPGCGQSVMTLSREQGTGAHLFWYAQVLGAYVIQILHVGVDAHNRSPQLIEFLWVQWFSVVPRYHWGFKEGQLPKVGFIPDSPAAFGFLNPSLVLRAYHLIPAFGDGRTNDLLRHGPTVAWPFGEVDDWTTFYVNIFTDQDMFARFARIGVSHQIQYILPNATEDENFVGDNDNELLAESNLEPSTSNAGGQILDSNVGNCQNQALGDETDGEDNIESDEDNTEPDEEEDIESDA